MPIKTVACLLTGDKYGDVYPLRLRNMVGRNLSGHRFVCFADREIHGIECLPVKTNWGGWWDKVGLFDNLPVQYPLLYLDLDMLILDDLSALESEQFTIIKQTKNIKSKKTVPRYNSSCMFFPEPGPFHVFSQFHESVKDLYRGDQDWIGQLLPDANTWPTEYFEYMENCIKEPPLYAKAVICNVVENTEAATMSPWVGDIWQ